MLRALGIFVVNQIRVSVVLCRKITTVNIDIMFLGYECGVGEARINHNGAGAFLPLRQNMKKLIFSVILGGVLAMQAAERPNILLIVVDDMGWSDLGCYGGEIDTPSIDRLADQGVRFTEYHVNPMCVVTRTSLISGHTHSQSDGYKRSLPFPRLMQQAGYSTSISGKWHQNGNPLDAGFDSFYGFLKGAINCWTGCDVGSRKPQVQKDRNAPQPVAADWYATDAFTDDAIRQIDAAVQVNRSSPIWPITRRTVRSTLMRRMWENIINAMKRDGSRCGKSVLPV